MAASSEGRPFEGPFGPPARSVSYDTHHYPIPTRTQQSDSRGMAQTNGSHPQSLVPNNPRAPSNHRRQKSEPRARSKQRTDSPSVRERSRGRTTTTRICGKCGGNLSGQFVRALGDTYHLECFTCNVRIVYLDHKISYRTDIALRIVAR